MAAVTYLGAAARHDIEPERPRPATRGELVDGMAQAVRELEAVQEEVGDGHPTVDQDARWRYWEQRWQTYHAAVVTMDLPPVTAD